jgi:hypothetical protein
MKATSLEILEKSELPTAQAHAILKVMESEMTFAQETLATKSDIQMLQAANRSDIQLLQAATKNDIRMFQEATKNDIQLFRAEMKNDIQLLRAETKNEILALRVEVKGIESALSRWVLTCILGQTTVLAGLGYFLIAHLGR